MGQKSKEKNVYLELVRIIACFLVIYNHSCSSYMLGAAPMNATRVLLLLGFFLCKVAVPMFLMVSGACLLGKEESYGKTLLRVCRMLLVLVAMSAVYNLLKPQPYGWAEFAEEVYKNPITRSYWYIYLYIGILLMLPILRKLKLEQKDYLYLTVLYVLVQGTLPVLGYYFQWTQPALETGLPLLSVYVYFFLMGHYFVKVKASYTAKGALLSGACLVASVGVSFFLSFMENRKNGVSGFDYIYEKEVYVLTAIAAISLFYLMGYIGKKIKKTMVKKCITYIGGCTFVIFLLSDMFLSAFSLLEWKGNYFLGVLVTDIGVFFAGLLVASVLRFIPGVRKILFS